MKAPLEFLSTAIDLIDRNASVLPALHKAAPTGDSEKVADTEVTEDAAFFHRAQIAVQASRIEPDSLRESNWLVVRNARDFVARTRSRTPRTNLTFCFLTSPINPAPWTRWSAISSKES